ncbi:MAG: hypothetical protein EBT57_08790 [Verrucomicrobia bacterium]|nr:hypothetical protein [Verrucomicrobiota bacterium]
MGFWPSYNTFLQQTRPKMNRTASSIPHFNGAHKSAEISPQRTFRFLHRAAGICSKHEQQNEKFFGFPAILL